MMSATDERCTILGIDPGYAHCGWGIVTNGRYVASGVLHTHKQADAIRRHHWIVGQLAALVGEYQPDYIAYEELTWRVHGRMDVRRRAPLERLIGGIWLLLPDAGQYIPMNPQEWGQQLLGVSQHGKEDIAYAVNGRLGTTFRGKNGGHDSDAVGLALVGWDTCRMLQHHRQGA